MRWTTSTWAVGMLAAATARYAASSTLTITMDDSRVPSLPVELLINVASKLTRVAGLYSFALVNVPCNYASTSLLYFDITLENPYAIRKCLDTLTRPSTVCSFQRDLPSFTRSFVVDWGTWCADEDQGSDEVLAGDMIVPDKSDLHAEFYMAAPQGVPRNGLRLTLENTVLRMHKLHRFACSHPGPSPASLRAPPPCRFAFLERLWKTGDSLRIVLAWTTLCPCALDSGRFTSYFQVNKWIGTTAWVTLVAS